MESNSETLEIIWGGKLEIDYSGGWKNYMMENTWGEILRGWKLYWWMEPVGPVRVVEMKLFGKIEIYLKIETLNFKIYLII